MWLFWFGAAVVVILVAVSFLKRDTSDARSRNALAELPAQSLGAFEPGFGRVTGLVAYADSAVAAPLSGTTCAYWRVVAEMYVPSLHGATWRQVADVAMGAKFHLLDEDGAAEVVLGKVVATLRPADTFTLGGPNESFEREAMVRFATQHWTYRPGEQVRFTEYRLSEGDRIVVGGLGHIRAGEAPNLVLQAGTDALYISDETIDR